jgi:hypothetical protein
VLTQQVSRAEPEVSEPDEPLEAKYTGKHLWVFVHGYQGELCRN